MTRAGIKIKMAAVIAALACVMMLGAGCSGSGAGQSGDGAGQAPGSAPADEGFDTWAAECTDANGNPTVYSLLELKGWQLETLLQQLGFSFDETEGVWMKEDGSAYVAVIGSDGAMDDDAIADLDKGAAGTPAIYMMGVPGYDSCKEALAAGQTVIEDSVFMDDGSGAALVYGTSMTEHIAMGTPGGGMVMIMLFNDEAAQSGLIDRTLSGSDSTSGMPLDDYWAKLKG